MTTAEEHIERWRQAGLLDAATAERIIAFERESPGETPKPAAPGQERPTVAEALLYLGVAVAAVGVFALAAQNWGDLQRWARVAVISVPAILVLVVGLAMQRAPEAGIRRAAGVAWLAGLALSTGALAVILNEYRAPIEDDRGVMLVIALACMALAIVLWVALPAHTQVLGLAGASFFFAMSAGAWPDDFSNGLAGLLIFGFGVAGIALAEAGVLTPRLSSRLLFAVLAGYGPWFAGIDGTVVWAEVLMFAAGAGLCALGVFRGSFTYVVVGVITIFVGLVTFIFEHFSDEVGAPVALMLSGACLIAGVLILTQARGVLRRGSGA